MARSLTNRFCGFVYVVAVASVTVLSVSCVKAGSDKTVTEALAHETDDKLGDPGFRPYSAHASAFLSAVDTATIAVYPTIVRKADRTSHSVESQKQIIALIRQKEMASPDTEGPGVRCRLPPLHGARLALQWRAHLWHSLLRL
jgi:hypothetical protein